MSLQMSILKLSMELRKEACARTASVREVLVVEAWPLPSEGGPQEGLTAAILAAKEK